MKIYVNDTDYQHFLHQALKDKITLVQNKHDAEYIISGSFKEDDYNPQLKGVIIPYTGHDRIDLNTLKNHDVKLFNTTVHSKFVAEKAVTLMFTLLGNMIHYHNELKKGSWNKRNTKERVPWVSVFDLNIGIYGYGRIGQWIHDMLKPFHTNIVVIDRKKDYPKDVLLVDSLEALVESSDVIFIAAPLNKYTEGAFNRDILNRMQDKYLINVGRGKIIHEDALFDSLNHGNLKGFASDVWWVYPSKEENTLPSNYPIHSFDNVVMSPHCGGFSTTSRKTMMKDVLKTIEMLLEENFSRALNIDTLN
ncbi:MAG: NAD(P)-dependent oxidoreductase [Candidatus Izemoplasmataceae bacterium]